MNNFLFLTGKTFSVNIHYVNLNHTSSEKSKHKSGKTANSYNVDVGDLVYLYSDKDKSRARSRYLVVSIDGEWCFIKMFSGNQLRSS